MLGTTKGTHGPGSVTADDTAAIDATVAAAANVDVAVLVLGDDLKTCAEMGDRSSLGLIGGQPDLLRRVAAVAKKTIVVLVSGRPITFNTGLCVSQKKGEGSSDNHGEGDSTRGQGYGFPWDPNARVGAACLQGSLLQNVSGLMMAWRPGAEGGACHS